MKIRKNLLNIKNIAIFNCKVILILPIFNLNKNIVIS